ncbi:hypothetical protein [Spirillospora sp. NPDC048819]|uniref:hypothetical protein n=1 Tax=Spirillospora sp. NPDC048819 TaxID=3155268 RepID=UPI0033F67292
MAVHCRCWMVSPIITRALTSPQPGAGAAERVREAAREQAEDFGFRRFTAADVARRCRTVPRDDLPLRSVKDALLDDLFTAATFFKI